MDPLDLPATPERLHALVRAGVIPGHGPAFDALLDEAAPVPSRAEWRAFVDRALLLLGSALVLAGAVFFVASNWAALGRFARMGLVAAAIAGAFAAALRLGLERLAGRVALLGASVLVGPLLAVYGQSYQTGADPFELFGAWALIILPWTLAADFAPGWLLLVTLLDTTVALLYQQASPDWLDDRQRNPLLALAAIDGLAWLAFEWRARRNRGEHRWPHRLLAAATFTPLVLLGLIAVTTGDGGFVGLAALTALVPASLWCFRRVVPDLFVLCAALGSAIAVAVVAIGRVLLRSASVSGLLLLGILVVVAIGGAAAWLRRIQRELAARGTVDA